MKMLNAVAAANTDIGSSPDAARLDQTFGNRCHALHQMPTINPVATRPCRRLAIGIAKPVHPNSSKTPADSPTARPTRRIDAFWSEVKMPGSNAGDTDDSPRSVAIIRTGQ